ncbi:MAG: ABC transporter ATP-binding protein [Deltaproteobacteria bacterium]|nr:ABC transporter ATP-binding protein [Deltaproteobacteria bacterium]
MNVRIDEVELRYNGTPVLRDVTLEVRTGELVALVGPNGAGKTTLLRAISGLLAPSHGAVYLDHEPVASLAPRAVATRLASVEQAIRCPEELRVWEAVSLGRLPHLGRFEVLGERDRAIVMAALERTEATVLAERRVTTLSSGERQRVWLAMALAQEPRVLLLDEPTSHLDIHFQMTILELVKSLAAGGLTVIASLHDLNLAAEFADRVALIAEHRLVGCGTPAEILTEERLERAYRTRVERVPLAGGGFLIRPRPSRAGG